MKSQDDGIVKGAKELQAKLDEILNCKEHAWFSGRLPADEAAKRKQAQKEFKKRYGK